MKVSIIGTGYVGLSLAVIISRYNEVVAVDIVKERIEMINRGISPIAENDLKSLLQSGELKLRATDSYEEIKGSVFTIVAVPTNYNPDTNYFDTHIVEDAIERVLLIDPNTTIVIKSTIPIGYTKTLIAKYTGSCILFSPEFLREGQSIKDNLHPNRIIVGVPNNQERFIEEASIFSKMLERCSDESDVPKLIMGSSEAESVKLFSNTFLAMRVAFFNELDTFALYNDLNSKEIIDGVCLDSRIDDKYNNPSFGYGGYCFPKDTKQLLANFDDVPNELIRAIVHSNAIRKRVLADDIMRKVEKGKTIGIYKLAMKYGSDNYRESSIIDIIKIIVDSGYNVIIYEPSIARDEFNGIQVVHDLDIFLKQSAIIVTNRMDKTIEKFSNKIYTRDLYRRD